MPPPAKKLKMSNQLITDVFPSSKLQHGKLITKLKQHVADDGKQDVEYPNEHEEKEVKTKVSAADLDVLREFDLNLEYGPCIGITRMERWNRAQKLGLDPPLNVRQLIEFHELDPKYTDCVWTAYNI
ncbi:DNA polymerase delta subunit 4 [Chamberlinius hualienensis]